MKTLSPTWLTDHTVDFEYKKYVLLDYLQHVETSYRLARLYPPLADLTAHYQAARSLKEKMDQFEQGLPKTLKGFDAAKQQLVYEPLFTGDTPLADVENILDYSLPQFERYIREGRQLYEHIEKEMQFEPVGVLPLEQRFGYLFVRNGGKKIAVYEYTLRMFESAGSRYRGIHTAHLCDYVSSVSTTLPAIKNDLLVKHRDLPNPAVYAAETKGTYPLEETTLPIAQRLLVRYIEHTKAL